MDLFTIVSPITEPLPDSTVSSLLSRITLYNARLQQLDLADQYTYNTAGRVVTKALSVSNGTASGLLTTTYGYDNLGALTSIQYPSPSPLTLTYTLDSLERPGRAHRQHQLHLGQRSAVQPGQSDHERPVPVRRRDMDV